MSRIQLAHVPSCPSTPFFLKTTWLQSTPVAAACLQPSRRGSKALISGNLTPNTLSIRIQDAGIAIRHSRGYFPSILQGPERNWRGAQCLREEIAEAQWAVIKVSASAASQTAWELDGSASADQCPLESCPPGALMQLQSRRRGCSSGRLDHGFRTDGGGGCASSRLDHGFPVRTDGGESTYSTKKDMDRDLVNPAHLAELCLCIKYREGD